MDLLSLSSSDAATLSRKKSPETEGNTLADILFRERERERKSKEKGLAPTRSLDQARRGPQIQINLKSFEERFF